MERPVYWQAWENDGRGQEMNRRPVNLLAAIRSAAFLLSGPGRIYTHREPLLKSRRGRFKFLAL